MTALISILGMSVLLGIAYIASRNKKAINIRTVLGAFLIQFLFGGFVLFVPIGRSILQAIADGVQWILHFASNGLLFVFGDLANPTGASGFIFATNVLGFIIFFSSLISVLYYLGIMQIIISIIGGTLSKLLKTSPAESMSATANIFVGQTEAPLVVKPYLLNMTKSEFFAVLCGGLASIAGAVMVGYAKMGVPLEYLLAAAFMSAPGGLLFAKIILPETDAVNTEVKFAKIDDSVNVIDAAASGALSGMKLTLSVGAMLIAFVALIHLIDGILGGIGGLFGYDTFSLSMIFGWVFSPLTWVMGVPWDEAFIAGGIIGQKVIVNEFVGYLSLVNHMTLEAATAAGVQVLSKHTQIVLSFALCGFANLSSIAILLGGIGTLVPQRRAEIARMGLYAVLAGSLSNFMSATIAGFFTTLL